jgi:hypothetical protein
MQSSLAAEALRSLLKPGKEKNSFLGVEEVLRKLMEFF